VQMLQQRLFMVTAMQKALADDKAKGLDVSNPEYLQTLRQRAMRSNMENMIKQLTASSDPKHKAQINMLRQSIANLDKMLSMTPQEQAVEFLRTQISHMEQSIADTTEQLTAVTKGSDENKEEKALQIGHSLFITKQVVASLKSTLEGDTKKIQSVQDVDDLRHSAMKTAVVARIKQLEAENKPEKYAQSITFLKARLKQLLTPHVHSASCSHGHGGHGHSHGDHGHGSHGHSHSHASHASHASHGHSHADHDDADEHDHGHSHGSHGHSHGGKGSQVAKKTGHGHSHGGKPCSGDH